MQSAMWITTIVLLLGNLGILVFLLKRLAAKDKTQDELLALRELVAKLENAIGEEVPRLEKAIKDEVRASQETTANTLTVQLQSTADTLVGAVGTLGEAQSQQLGNVVESINNLTQTNEEKLQAVQASNETKLEQIRQSVNEQLQTAVDTLVTTVGELGETQKRQLDSGTKAINDLTQANETSIENVRTTLTTGLKDLQTSNESKLETDASDG